jgi:hypothetical protein
VPCLMDNPGQNGPPIPSESGSVIPNQMALFKLGSILIFT